MVTYNPKDWFKLIFQFHKSDTFRILFSTMIVLGLVTAGVSYVEQEYFAKQIPSAIIIFHQISGFIISLVLVFRINTAYDRWWEGRKLWGSLLNNARNLGLKLNVLLPQQSLQERKEVKELISDYAFSLRNHLRSDPSSVDIIFNSQLTAGAFSQAGHKPNLIARQLLAVCQGICERHQKSQNDYLIVTENLSQFTDIAGACERIRSTPIPYSYSIFIKKIIFLYIITMPIGFGLTLGYWSVPTVMIMFYAFASLELISEEIEDPFGTDSNDLPTDEIAGKIRQNLEEIL